MSRLSSVLKDRSKRPRLVVWLGLVAMVVLAFTALSTIGTSVNWFCTGPCHVVHDDNTLTFNESTHVMQSCVACHEPVNASPVTFVLKKVEVLPDLFPTVLGTFELPMNENQSIAFAMPDEQCTQCHTLENRIVTASAGLIMDHSAHSAAGVNCTSCHNRVAHPEEDVTYTLEGDAKHESWMGMDACFRCHSLETGARAPGECTACHPPDFNLVPASHVAGGWYAQYGDSTGHAAAASEETSRVAAAEKWVAGLDPVEDRAGIEMGYEQTVNTCYTCHTHQFCTDCHGVEMPHPAEFATDHGDAGRENPAACAKCHARTEAEASGDAFCNACHHPSNTPGVPWIQEHFVGVKTGGTEQCLACHNPRYCSACHVGGEAAAQRYLEQQEGQ